MTTTRMPAIGAMLAGLVAFALLIWILWPEAPPTRAAITAASEVVGWQKGLEAGRGPPAEKAAPGK